MRRSWSAIAAVACMVLLAGLSACRRESRRAGAPAKPGAAVAASAALPEPDLGYNAREGRALFRHYCAPCHGEEGHGDGFNAFNLDPRPRDLGAADFQAQRSDEDLASILRTGGGAAGLSSAMPPWGRTLNQRGIENLVRYLRTLRPVQPGER